MIHIRVDNYYTNISSEERALPLYIVTIGESLPELIVRRPAGIPDYQILYCLDGEGSVTVKNTEYALTKGHALILPPFAPHEYGQAGDTPWHTLWITYNGRAAAECFGFGSEIRDLSAIPFKEHFVSLLSQKQEKSFRRKTSSELYELLLYCDECPTQDGMLGNPRNEEGIFKVISYISENYTKTIELRELASISELSEGHLCRVFKEYTHMRPVEYVTHIRIEKSKTLLLTFPDASISSIARKVGFDDPSYFSKIFKDKCSVTPSEFRQIAKIKQ